MWEIRVVVAVAIAAVAVAPVHCSFALDCQITATAPTAMVSNEP